MLDPLHLPTTCQRTVTNSQPVHANSASLVRANATGGHPMVVLPTTAAIRKHGIHAWARHPPSLPPDLASLSEYPVPQIQATS